MALNEGAQMRRRPHARKGVATEEMKSGSLSGAGGQA
jgi:hypothetical protein